MSKINVTIEVDTEEHTMSVSINGEKVNNASSVYCYKYYNSYEQEEEVNVSISSSEENEETGVTKNVTYYACGTQKAKEVTANEAITTLPGFVGVKQIDATKAVAEYLLKKVR